METCVRCKKQSLEVTYYRVSGDHHKNNEIVKSVLLCKTCYNKWEKSNFNKYYFKSNELYYW